jgi:tRNA threonylcarbamoyladenosine modification (KEOPS) complex  Pcc1 subunit
MDDFDVFFDEYDDLSQRLLGARYQDFAAIARRVLNMLDGAPDPLGSRIRWLRLLYPLERVEADVLHEQSGIGPGRMTWPEDLERSLSGQLNLLASLTRDDDAAWRFAHDYFYSRSNNINDTLHEMTEHLLDPMFRDLRRYLVRNRNTPLPADEIPASDRIVRLDHNQPAYAETIGAIETTTNALLGDNVVSPEDRDRIKFELDSGIILLKAQSVRISAIEAVLTKALRWLSLNFAGAALGIAAERALMAVLSLIGAG